MERLRKSSCLLTTSSPALKNPISVIRLYPLKAKQLDCLSGSHRSTRPLVELVFPCVIKTQRSAHTDELEGNSARNNANRSYLQFDSVFTGTTNRMVCIRPLFPGDFKAGEFNKVSIKATDDNDFPRPIFFKIETNQRQKLERHPADLRPTKHPTYMGQNCATHTIR